jgi:hypothetical protein
MTTMHNLAGPSELLKEVLGPITAAHLSEHIGVARAAALNGSFRRAAIYIPILFIILASIADAQSTESPKPCERPQLTERASVGGYVFKAYKDANFDASGCFRVFLQGRLIYERATDDTESYNLGQAADPESNIPFVPNGSDLTGNGKPNMVVTGWSGGAHCCFTHYIFELRPRLRLIAKLEDGDTDGGHFEDLDHDGHYYYITYDIWPYWPGSFASSVSHKVILRWNGQKFALDLARMQFAPPSPQQWQSALKDVDEAVRDGGDNPDAMGQTLWDTTLDLIYTGHSDLAWKFIREANPRGLQGKNPSLADFCGMLKSSPYWPDIKPTTKQIPQECAKAKETRQE